MTQAMLGRFPSVSPHHFTWNALLLAVLLLAMSGCAAVGSTADMLDTGYKFMVALRDGDDAAAFGLCCPALQTQLVDAAGLHGRAAEMRPVRWQIQHWHLCTAGEQTTAYIVSHATLAGGRHADVTLELARADDGWRITDFHVQ